MMTLEQEVADLKTRLAHLEAVIRRLAGDTPQTGGLAPTAPLEQAELLTWLKAHGVVRDPTAEECHVAAEWDTLPDEEKQAHIEFMQQLVLDPPLSQMLIAQRR